MNNPDHLIIEMPASKLLEYIDEIESLKTELKNYKQRSKARIAKLKAELAEYK